MTSVNWRVEIIKLFIKAIKKINLNNKIITTDIKPTEAAIYFSDNYYIVPLYSDPEYWNFLENLCKKEKISYIIPQTDQDCKNFSKKKKLIESWGTIVLMPQPKIIEILTDKYKAQKFFESKGFLVPKQYNNYKLDEINDFPLILKPRDDSGTNLVFKVNNLIELKSLIKRIKNPMIEKFIEGSEFTIDGVGNLDGSLIGLVPRKRLKIKGGISVIGLTEYNEKLISLCKKICHYIRPKGFFCIQMIAKDGDFYLTEINPRIGSGIVLSIKAGMDIEKIFRAYENKLTINFKDDFFENELYMLNYLKPIYKKFDINPFW